MIKLLEKYAKWYVNTDPNFLVDIMMLIFNTMICCLVRLAILMTYYELRYPGYFEDKLGFVQIFNYPWTIYDIWIIKIIIFIIVFKIALYFICLILNGVIYIIAPHVKNKYDSIRTLANIIRYGKNY